MTNLKSMSLKAAIALAAPLLFAYGNNGGERDSVLSGVSLGGEVYASGTNLNFSGNTALDAAGETTIQQTQNHFAVSALNWAEGQDKLLNYGFGGAVVARMSLSDMFNAMARLSIHSKYKDAQWLTSDSTPDVTAGVAKVKNVIVTPSVLVGMSGMFVGAGYQMVEFEFPALGGNSITTAKSNQIIGMLRAEADIETDGMNFNVFAFAETSFSQKSTSDVKDYLIVALAQNGITEQTVAAPTEGYTSYNQVGIGLGASFYDM